MYNRNTLLHIGIDDTDSLEGSCTTYIATKIVEKIHKEVTFIDFPRLIRNNPNIPWKTRGNGSVCLSFKAEKNKADEIITQIKEIVQKYYSPSANTNPGMVVVKGEIPAEIKDFALRTLVSVIKIEEAQELISRHAYEHFSLGNGRGLIGALAAIGNTLEPKKEDYTFELLAYRLRSNWGKKRLIDAESVKQMDQRLSPKVFNNIDEFSGKVLITPAGKDPVLFGIRGESPAILLQALKLVRALEPIECYCIFRTNQGTDQHFAYATNSIEEYSVFRGTIEIIDCPKVIPGGHVIVKGRIVDTNTVVDVAAFEPTKKFRFTLRKLIPGDIIQAYGGFYYEEKAKALTLHLEKYEIMRLVPKIEEHAPLCPKCGKRTESAGRNKGYRCKKCGFKDPTLKKVRKEIPREFPFRLLIPPAQAQRHLVKPLIRYGQEKINLNEDLPLLLGSTQWWECYKKGEGG